MMTYGDLRELSLDFRRLSSSFLNSTQETASVLIQRFKAYIDNTLFISELLKKATDSVEYDFNDCFRRKELGGWHEMAPPVEEACHIKAMYDYITAIIDNNANVLGVAMSYYHSSRKIDDQIQSFLQNAFKPLIDYINDSISKEMIIVEEEAKRHSLSMAQNIENVHGTVIQQGTGSITSYTHVVNSESQAILDLLERIIPSLEKISGVPGDVVEDVKDDLLSISEQVKSPSPKKSRLHKGLSGIKKFAGEFALKLGVTLAATAVTQTDWQNLISQVEIFLASLH